MTTVTGERPTKRIRRIRPHFGWSWSHMVKPRLYFYVDAWTGGSLMDVGFEVVSSWSDPVIHTGIELQAKPGSPVDWVLVKLWQLDQWWRYAR